MAKPRRKTVRRVVKRRPVAAVGAPADRTLMVELLKEMHPIMLDAAAQIGVCAEDRDCALKLAAKDPIRARPSERTLRAEYCIARLLNRWRNDKHFQCPDGTPRVLPIFGKIATFATLARRFVLQLAVSELADMIYEDAS